MKLIRSDFDHPPLEVTENKLRHYFSSATAAELRPLRNPHHEPRVSEEVKNTARSAAVLIPFIFNGQATMLFTRRTPGIRFAGHICFPGGTRDGNDSDAVATALRETREEIDLHPERVEIIGRLGDYHTQTGYRITPVVGLLIPPVDLTPHPDEVAEIIEVPLRQVFDAASYKLFQRIPGRAHYSLQHRDARIAGPTVSIMMGFYEELLRSTIADHTP